MDIDEEGYYLGAPRMELLANTCWWVDTYALYEKPALYHPAPGPSQVWRLRVARRYSDSAPESWSSELGPEPARPPGGRSRRGSPRHA